MIPGIICLHPGWMRTNEGNAAAPLVHYDHAQMLLALFEKFCNEKKQRRYLSIIPVNLTCGRREALHV